MSQLTATRVEEIFEDCLHSEADGVPPTQIEGITETAEFNLNRLNQHADEIEQMLGELLIGFRYGGMAFRDFCCNQQGGQWTLYQHIMEHLLLLGLALDKIEIMTPRNIWPSLANGGPIITIKQYVARKG